MASCRQNYHEECEAAINKQINMELHASIAYLALAAHFGRDDVSLKGFAKYFMDCSKEEREHAGQFIGYQNLRGGRVVLQPIESPVQYEWESPLCGVELALELEKEVSQAILNLRFLAEHHADKDLGHFLDANFIDEQVQAVNKLAGMVANLKQVGNGVGVYEFDKELQ